MFIFLVVIVLLILFIIGLYNNLIRLKNLVNNAFSSTDVILKKRYDLIPNLVETVKGYMNHEASVLEKITELRTQAINNDTPIDEKIQIDKDISKDVKHIFAVSENYPDLKASENFLKLQDAIVDVEDEIAAARRTFNAAATEYNINIHVFPNSMLAGMLGFYDVALFETKENERESIKINLG